MSPVGGADFHRPADVHQAIDQRIGNATHGHGQTAGHAAFAGTAEGRGLNGFDGLIQIGIGHDDEMVFRPAGGLHSLAVARAGFINVLGHIRC